VVKSRDNSVYCIKNDRPTNTTDNEDTGGSQDQALGFSTRQTMMDMFVEGGGRRVDG